MFYCLIKYQGLNFDEHSPRTTDDVVKTKEPLGVLGALVVNLSETGTETEKGTGGVAEGVSAILGSIIVHRLP